MSAYTPGPWRAVKRAQPIGWAEWEVAWSDDGELVCDVVYHEADARLIAAAPELLEALTRLRDCYSTSHSLSTRQSCWDQAIAAIAKATGEQP